MVTVPHMLLVLAVLAVRGGVAFVRPRRRCPRCKGERIARSRWNGRIVRCPKCGGTGIALRPESRLLHAWFWALTDRPRERVRERIEEEQ